MTAEPSSPQRRNPWLPLVLLLFVGILNYLDRVLPSVLAEPIKRDLALSDTALGIINGVGFLLIYAAASIPMAQLSDKGYYNYVISGALAVWSAMTAAGALVTNGVQMALTRMGVAVGEAAGMPAAHAFITRNFPPERRAAPIAFYNLSLPLGSMGGFVLGGLVGEALGWRQTFLLMGGLGLLLAATTWLVLPRQVERRPAAEAKNLTLLGFLPLLRKRSMVFLLLGSGFVGMGGYTTTGFTPSFLMRSHGMSLGEAGLQFGLAAGAASAVSLLLAGWVADRLSVRDPRWLIGVVIIMIVAALPVSFASFRLVDSGYAIAALAVNQVIPIAYAAPITVAMHRLAPVELRARTSALLLLSTGIAGGFGPVIAGAISDALAAEYGQESLRHALDVIPVVYLLGAICYAIAMTRFRAEIIDAD